MNTTHSIVSTSNPSRIGWARRLLIVLLAVVSLGSAGAAVSADSAQADVGPVKEYIWNTNDTVNAVIGVTMTDGRFLTIAPGVRVNWNIKSFTIPRGYCANVKYNGGYPQKRYPGTHTSFVDGVVLTINPYKQRSDGYCI